MKTNTQTTVERSITVRLFFGYTPKLKCGKAVAGAVTGTSHAMPRLPPKLTGPLTSSRDRSLSEVEVGAH